MLFRLTLSIICLVTMGCKRSSESDISASVEASVKGEETSQETGTVFTEVTAKELMEIFKKNSDTSIKIKKDLHYKCESGTDAIFSTEIEVFSQTLRFLALSYEEKENGWVEIRYIKPNKGYYEWSSGRFGAYLKLEGDRLVWKKGLEESVREVTNFKKVNRAETKHYENIRAIEKSIGSLGNPCEFLRLGLF